jgi:hypothetical protein
VPFYDVGRLTTGGSGGVEKTHFWAKTVANQETVYITGFYLSVQTSSLGGCQARIKDNSGTIASGGTAQTPAPRNRRASPAAQSVWANDASAITAGTTLTTRVTVGHAQQGGVGGWVATEAGAKIAMMANGTNPVDMEFTSQNTNTGVHTDVVVEFTEGY